MNQVERSTLPVYEDDPRQLRTAFSFFPSGVVALLAQIDGEVQGMVASAFTVGVSTEPPLVSCAIQSRSTTWPLLRRADRLGVSVLASHQGALARQISGRDRSARFTGVPLRETGSSARFIAEAPVWFECETTSELPAGDHVIVLLEVKALGADPERQPLIFHGSEFRELRLRPAELE